MSAPYSEGGATMPSEIGSTPTIVSAPACARKLRRSLPRSCSSVPRIAGVLEEHGGRPGESFARRSSRSRPPVAASWSTSSTSIVTGQLGRAAVGPDHGEPLGAHRRGHEHVAATGEARGHPDRVALGAAPAVDGQADEIHPDQLAELARELEPGLVAAVVGGRRAPDRASGTRSGARSRRRSPARGAARCRRRGS